jgi:hypothetical protein
VELVGVHRLEGFVEVGGVPEEVDLLLLAHDQVLEQVLERLAAGSSRIG